MLLYFESVVARAQRPDGKQDIVPLPLTVANLITGCFDCQISSLTKNLQL